MAAEDEAERLAAEVSECLRQHGIDAVLTGGTVISIYSDNAFRSHDLDFITAAGRAQLDAALATIGFLRGGGRHYIRADTAFIVEFPSGPLMVGRQLVQEVAEHETAQGRIRLLTPTDAVKDRLAAFFHWSDRQSLEQALAVVERQPINWADLDRWAKQEAADERYAVFQTRAKSLRSNAPDQPRAL